MKEENSENFQENMPVYNSKCFLVKNLYWDRIKTAINFANLNDKQILLDLGCNNGPLLKTIRKYNKNCTCWGVDLEPDIMTLDIENCKFKIADVKNLPFNDNYFDVIFALSTLEHIEDIDMAIKEIKRVLKPKGFVILSSPTESLFYRLCRFLLFGVSKKNALKNKPGFRRDVDLHFQTAYSIEKKFKENGFTQILHKSLPHFPLPELHRIIKFQK